MTPNVPYDLVHNIPALIERFLEAMVAERGASENTIVSYRHDLEALQQHLTTLSATEINEAVCSSFLRGSPSLSSPTLARRFSALNQFFTFLMSEQIITENPLGSLDRPKAARRLPGVLTLEEVLRLIEAAQRLPGQDGLRAVAILELFYASGLRVSELVSLPRNALILHKGLMVRGKGQKDRFVPLHKEAQDAVMRYEATLPPLSLVTSKISTPWLFPSRKNPGCHITRRRCGQILKSLAIEAQIPPEKVHPHALRHAFATHLLEGGVNLVILQKLLGHSNIATTEIYTHVSSAHTRKALESAHPLTPSEKR